MIEYYSVFLDRAETMSLHSKETEERKHWNSEVTRLRRLLGILRWMEQGDV